MTCHDESPLSAPCSPEQATRKEDRVLLELALARLGRALPDCEFELDQAYAQDRLVIRRSRFHECRLAVEGGAYECRGVAHNGWFYLALAVVADLAAMVFGAPMLMALPLGVLWALHRTLSDLDSLCDNVVASLDRPVTRSRRGQDILFFLYVVLNGLVLVQTAFVVTAAVIPRG